MSKNPLLSQCVCLISPYKRWIDLYCQTTMGTDALQSKVIDNAQQLNEHLSEQSNGDLFGEKTFFHLQFKQFSTLKLALSIKSHHIFSITSATKPQIQSLAKASMPVKVMQYPKRSDLQTMVHQFAKQKNIQIPLTHLLEGHDDNIDNILEACEREHLLSLNQSPVTHHNPVHSTTTRGFDICKLIYQSALKDIATLVQGLNHTEMNSAYWLITKHLHIHHQSSTLSGADLMKLTPFKPLHASINQWHAKHQKHLVSYLKLAWQFESKMKGGVGSDLKTILLDLALKMGQPHG
jgi:hypothetical protein